MTTLNITSILRKRQSSVHCNRRVYRQRAGRQTTLDRLVKNIP